MSQPIKLNATVKRFGNEKTLLYPGISDAKETLALDTNFDPVHSECAKMYKNDVFEGNLPAVKYMSKDAYINQDAPLKGYLIQKEENPACLADDINTTNDIVFQKDLLEKGLALIANRTMLVSRFYSYPKTYIVGNAPEQSQRMVNILDYQRAIFLTFDWNTSSGMISAVVSIVDFAPFIYSNELNYSVFTFYISAAEKSGYILVGYPYIPIAFDPDKITKYFALPKDATLNNRSSKNYHLTDFLTTYQQTGKDKNYIHPKNELYFAALYLVDYYSRNIESPAFLEKNGSHGALVYICRNIEKIKTVWKAAMHLGILATHPAVNEFQHGLPVPSDALDEQKVQSIDALFQKSN
jgi:hypothetical protein